MTTTVRARGDAGGGSLAGRSHPGHGVRVPSLDGWRGISIVLVLVSHFTYAGQFPWQDLGDWGLLFDGEFGVRIFFILSGFIITLLLREEGLRRGDVSLRHFYLRRSLRILPVYFTFLFVLGLVAAAGWYRDSAGSWLGSLTFTRNMVGRGDSATVHCWSLAIEEQFYLLWPLLFARVRLWTKPRLALGLGVLVLAACVAVRSNSPTLDPSLTGRLLGARSLLRYADSLTIGCAAAFAYWRHPDRLARGLPRWGWAVLLAVVAAGQWITHRGNVPAVVDAFVPIVQGGALGVLILFSTSTSAGPIHSFLNLRVLATTGVLSYSLYIWHPLFLSGFMGWRWAEFPTHHWLVWWIGAVLAAVFSFSCIERPFLRLRRAYSRT